MSPRVRKRHPDYEAGELSYPIKKMPGEGLSDIIFRASAENGYFRSSVVTSLAGLGGGQTLTHFALAGKVIDAQRVAFMLGLSSSEDVEALAYPATRSAKTHFKFFGREVRGKTFFQSFRKVAPSSLRQHCYQKAIWAVRGITFDPTTWEQLIFRCPVCNEFLRSARSYGVEYCSVCYDRGNSVDLRDFPQPGVEVDDEEALRLCVELIDPEVMVSDIDLTKIPEEMRRFGPGAVFELISNIARLLNLYRADGSPTNRDLVLQYQTPVPEDMASAARAVMNWPAGLDELHEEILYKQRNKVAEMAELVPTVRLIVKLLDRDFQMLLLSKFTEGQRRLAYKSLASLTVEPDHAKARFEFIKPESFRSNRKNGLRQAYAVAHSSRTANAPLSSADARLLMLYNSWHTRQFSESSGIPIPFLIDFFEGNLIEMLDQAVDPYVGRCDDPPKVPFEERILSRASDRERPQLTLPLGHAVSALSSRRTNSLLVTFAAVLNGSLEVWHEPGRGPLTTRLRVGDFDRLRAVLKLGEVTRHLDEFPAELRTVRLILGLGEKPLWQLRGTRMLQSDLSLKDLWLFREQFILSSEIGRRFSIATGAFKSHMHLHEKLKLCEKVGPGTTMIYKRQVIEERLGALLARRDNV